MSLHVMSLHVALGKVRDAACLLDAIRAADELTAAAPSDRRTGGGAVADRGDLR